MVWPYTCLFHIEYDSETYYDESVRRYFDAVAFGAILTADFIGREYILRR